MESRRETASVLAQGSCLGPENMQEVEHGRLVVVFVSARWLRTDSEVPFECYGCLQEDLLLKY